MNKRRPKCGDEKQFPEEFNSQGTYCKKCHTANSEAWRKANPDKIREIKRTQNARKKEKNPELYREIQRRGSAAHYQRNRAACIARSKIKKDGLRRWFKSFKKTLCCSKCKCSDHRCLAFHHLGDKEHTICDMVRKGRSKKSILKEIAKCIVLCHNCHAIEHYEDEWDV
jgi:hypothetical protein